MLANELFEILVTVPVECVQYVTLSTKRTQYALSMLQRSIGDRFDVSLDAFRSS